MDCNHSDVARLPKVVRDLVDRSGARSVWVRGEPPGGAAGSQPTSRGEAHARRLGIDCRTVSPPTGRAGTAFRRAHRAEGAKVRVGGARQTCSDLQRQLKACRKGIAHAPEPFIEAMKLQTTTSEVLRIISNCPSELQAVLDAVAENAARLCDANNARIWRLEDNRLRIAAAYGEISAKSHGREGLPVNRETVTGRATCDRRTIHVHDLAAADGNYPVGSKQVNDEGYRTTLATPLLREASPIGIILVRRMEVRPFHDKQIALLETVADQAVIAIENAREAKARRLVEANVIGIFISDLEGRMIEANGAFLRLLGYDPQDLVSGRMRWLELTPPEWHGRSERALTELNSTGSVRPYEKEFFRKDGTCLPVLIGGALFEERRNEGVSFVLDLTERKRAEEALRESEAKFRDFAETASDWLWEMGPDYKFTLLTENAFGSDPAGRIGTAAGITPLTLKPNRRSGGIFGRLSIRVNRSGTLCIARRGDGSPMYVKASGKPVFDANGEFRGYRGTGTDVTAIMRAQRAEESLRTVQAELAHVSRVTTLGQLTASIAHEVKQPMAAARNNACAALNFLNRSRPDLGEVREALSCIVGTPIAPEASSTGSEIRSKKRLRERFVLILMKTSMRC